MIVVAFFLFTFIAGVGFDIWFCCVRVLLVKLLITLNSFFRLFGWAESLVIICPPLCVGRMWSFCLFGGCCGFLVMWWCLLCVCCLRVLFSLIVRYYICCFVLWLSVSLWLILFCDLVCFVVGECLSLCFFCLCDFLLCGRFELYKFVCYVLEFMHFWIV